MSHSSFIDFRLIQLQDRNDFFILSYDTIFNFRITEFSFICFNCADNVIRACFIIFVVESLFLLV